MNRVLLLSSDPILKQKNIDVLVANGFNVTETSDAGQGLILADNDGFAAIIIDEELSDIDGYRASRKIREYSLVPIILLGTEATDKIWAQADSLGFDIYLQKPIRPRELTSYIKAILRRTQDQKTDQVQKSDAMHHRAADPLPYTGQTKINDTINPVKSGNGKKPDEPYIQPVAVDKTTQPARTEPMTATEEVYATCVPQESYPEEITTIQGESMATIVAAMEHQIIKIKKTMVRFGQVHRSIEDIKLTIHQQRQGLLTLENRLQEINHQLEKISRDPL
jgi:CheY-like chemotaxis protein